MKSFNQFITESKILNEGGNAPFINRKTGDKLGDAHKIWFVKNEENKKTLVVNRTKLRESLLNMFEDLNELYEKEHGSKLWNDFNVVRSGHAFNGSSYHFFNGKEKLTDAEFIKLKPTMGDVDVTIDGDKLGPLFDVLAKNEGKVIGDDFVYMGQNKPKQQGHQINAIFQLQNPKVNVQVDFEGVEYEKNKPTPFSKFSHSSHLDDMRVNIKGVGHKLLLQNLARAISEMKNIVVLTPTSIPPDKITVSRKASALAPTNLAFSVDRGIRKKYVPVMHDGKQVEVDGKLAYKEVVKAKKEDHITEISTMFMMLFNIPKTDSKEEFEKKHKDDLENFESFTGLLKLMGTYLDENTVKKTFKFLLDKSLFGKGAQGFEKNNPEGDKKIKMQIVEALVKKFPYLKPIYNGYEEQIQTYYDNYKTVKVEA